MSQVMVKCFFGLNPDIAGDVIKKSNLLNLNAKLHHVLYGGEYYRMELKEGEVRMEKENK